MDGGDFNPGLCDKIRGILSTYYITKKLGMDFEISWIFPFELEDYLIPNKLDWRIKIEFRVINKSYFNE